MFGWIRKLTQRTAVEELIDSSASIAPEASAADTRSQQASTPRHEEFARPADHPADRPAQQAPVQHAFVEQQTPEPQMVDVYTPEPMPEPPTFELPEPELVDSFESDDADVEPDVDVESEATVEPDAGQSLEVDARYAEFQPVGAHVEAEIAPEVEMAPADIATESPASHEPVADEPASPEPSTPVTASAAGEEPTDSREHPTTAVEVSPLAEEFDGLLAAPSPRPAMPLSAHPNFAGLGLAKWEPIAPRLLEPEAALTPEAQEQLLKLFDDLFGPCGRYRLEWRTERHPGDDAMFAEIMTADLVRRVQNTIADVAELERPEPPKAIQAAFLEHEVGADEGEDEADSFRRAS